VTKHPSARPVAGWRWHLGLGLGFTALAVLMTWPLGSPTARVVPDMDDAYFSIWRLAWVAHQLVHQPAALFDANIFYPARHALAYSDAMLLVGLAAAPFLWAGVPPALVHNGLLIAALSTSAWAMAILAHRLTGDRAAAILAGIVLGFAPYRFAHLAHLELQWLLWMPLALLALHALVERPRPLAGLALGACLAAQLLCSIYYAVFLGVFVAVAWIALVAATGTRSRLLPSTAAAAIPLALVAVPYLMPYAASRSAHAPRTPAEVARYSATPADYLRVPSFNALRGANDPGPAPEERALYPGLAAVILAMVGLWYGRGRTRWIYGALAVLAFDASLGVHGLTFRVLQTVAPPLGNLRAPARFASLGLVVLAALAAIGATRVREAFTSRVARDGVVAIAVALCLIEFWSHPLPVRDATLAPAAVDRWLAGLPDDTVILELPVPTVHALWGYEMWHQVRSIHHWRRLLNGYSGFLPRDSGNTLIALATFPDTESVARLRRLSVDFVVVRRENFTSDDAYARATSPLLSSRDFGAPLVLGAGLGEAAIFPLRRQP
jgi:hypothetical protein